MLIFLDETFRTNVRTRKRFGVLCGVGIPEEALHEVANQIYRLKLPYFGEDYAKERELKGKELLKSYAFKMAAKYGHSRNLELAREVLQFLHRQNVRIFGVVCFDESLRSFRCDDAKRMDITFRYLFERVDLYMKNEFPDRLAKLVFDDRDHETNANNATAITNFFLRSAVGRGYNSILRVPFFAVSQAQNVGLQLADVVTTVVGKEFEGDRRIQDHWRIVQSLVYHTSVHGLSVSSLKVIR